MYLSIDKDNKSISWMPLQLDDESPIQIYSTAAALLQDDDIPVVLFLTDTYTIAKVPEKAYMMVSFTNNGLGPVVTSSLYSCMVLYEKGPSISGLYSTEANQGQIQEYLDTVEDEIVFAEDKLPTNGYQLAEVDEIHIAGVSSNIFLGSLKSFENNLT
jgi:hypothetical protein